ncbi:hypothetical protein [Trujillonella humicola]|uniref:hypothetical protein n=1 Tax=Trujillonella humicola TaxID=3383699 RepID=UPI00390598C6
MDQTITQGDLAALARKLDELGDVLTEKEQTLLLAVFRLAGKEINDRVRASASSGSGSQTESGRAVAAARTTGRLSAGFKDAFVPVGTADFNLRGGLDEVAGGVGIGVVY